MSLRFNVYFSSSLSSHRQRHVANTLKCITSILTHKHKKTMQNKIIEKVTDCPTSWTKETFIELNLLNELKDHFKGPNLFSALFSRIDKIYKIRNQN